MNNFVMAFDPGKDMGISMWWNGKYICAAQFNGEGVTNIKKSVNLAETLFYKEMKEVYGTCHAAKEELKKSRRYCVVEDGFVGINKMSSLKLAFYRGIIQGICISKGYSATDMIMPVSWLSYVWKKFKSQVPRGETEIENTKTKSLACSKAITQFNAPSNNVADAVCLGYYFISTKLKEVKDVDHAAA